MGDKIVQHLREVAPHFDDAKPLMRAAADRIEALQAERVAVVPEPVERALRHIEGCLTFPVSTEINARGYDTRTPTPETVEYMVQLVREARAAICASSNKEPDQ